MMKVKELLKKFGSIEFDLTSAHKYYTIKKEGYTGRSSSLNWLINNLESEVVCYHSNEYGLAFIMKTPRLFSLFFIIEPRLTEGYSVSRVDNSWYGMDKPHELWLTNNPVIVNKELFDVYQKEYYTKKVVEKL